MGKALQEITDYMPRDIEGLFRARDFLVSPLNSPEKFLGEQYFLTDQQEKIEKELFRKLLHGTGNLYFGITGGAGTGKTLLLYDIARKISGNGKVCIIHCGFLSPGHEYLNQQLKEIDIKPIRDIAADAMSHLDSYSFILVDEAQRIYKEQYDSIVNYVKDKNIKCIFSYDSRQTLSAEEQNRNIAAEIGVLCGKETYRLSDKIRTNKELAAFIKALLDLRKRNNTYRYDCVDVLFAKDYARAYGMLEHYRKNYTFINFTLSRYSATKFDAFGGELNTHKVIGQEYDNVVMVLDDTFYYDANGVLCAKEHPNPNYLYHKLLFQGVSRTRERLCLIILRDIDLFKQINEIKIQGLI